MDTIVSYLTSHPFFYSVGVKDILSFSSAALIESYDPGSYIMHQGEVGDSLVMIMAGDVCILREDEKGRETLIARRGSGEIIGEMAIYDREIRMFSVKALDSVKLLRIDGESFRSVVHKFPDVKEKTQRLIAQRSALQDFYEADFETECKQKDRDHHIEMDPSLPYLLIQLNDAAGGAAQKEHCKEVAFLSREISRIICPAQSEFIYWAGLLHEIGKISLVENETARFRKKEPLSAEENEKLERIYDNAIAILRPDEELSAQVSFIKYLNKEHFVDMPLETQILKVANDYLEMVDKKYQDLSAEQAMQNLKAGSEMIYNPAIIKALEEVLDKFQTLRIDNQLNFMRMLNIALDAKDNITLEHSKATVAVALLLGKKIGLEREQLEEFKLGCELHNVGMINVPYEIINAPRKLSEEEFAVIKQHPADSAAFFDNIKGMEHLSSFILSHHERFDGTGYPLGLSGEAIPLYSRILRVADVYSALRKPRAYRTNRKGESTVYKPMMALTIMLQMQPGAFDPELLSLFKDMIKSGELKSYSEEL